MVTHYFIARHFDRCKWVTAAVHSLAISAQLVCDVFGWPISLSCFWVSRHCKSPRRRIVIQETESPRQCSDSPRACAPWHGRDVLSKQLLSAAVGGSDHGLRLAREIRATHASVSASADINCNSRRVWMVGGMYHGQFPIKCVGFASLTATSR